MTPLQKITPYLWYDHDAQAAVDLYVSLFPNSRVISVERIPSGPGEDGAIVEFELDGQRMTAFDGGPMFKFSEAVSFVVSCETQEEIDHYWHGLSEGGEQQQCGWLKDPYGLSWQIVPAALAERIAAAPQAGMDG
ncbi:MAG: VOC family protein, partial [Chloroflexi bacterium]|nr:VOC family protein [Chloroflexota bacterium]